MTETCRVAYDLDGTLATQPPPSEKTWGYMKGPERNARKQFLLDHYKEAAKIMDPPQEKFIIITARKNSPEIIRITKDWVNFYFAERVPEIFFLSESRSVENVVKFKSEILKKYNIENFYEDNPRVLKGLVKAAPRVNLFIVKNGGVLLFHNNTN